MKPLFSYLDPSQSIEARVADLLARMTLTEKCAQLIGPFGLDDGDGSFSLELARKHFSNGISYVNSHHHQRNTRQTVVYLNALQKFLREETRLGIPMLALGEGLHGYMAHEATSFPQAIGLASAWDPELHERVFGVVAREMRARGAQYVLSPVILPATRAGAAPRKRTVRTLTWFRSWGWRRCAVCKGNALAAIRSMCWRPPSILPPTASPKVAGIVPRPTIPSGFCAMSFWPPLKRWCAKPELAR